MFKQHPQQINNLLQTIIRNNGLETPLLQRRILNAWDEVAGPLVSRYTIDKRIDNQTLVVSIQNPSLRSELSMQKSRLVTMLNAKVGATIIYDIRFS